MYTPFERKVVPVGFRLALLGAVLALLAGLGAYGPIWP
jgi:hypothetical protein